MDLAQDGTDCRKAGLRVTSVDTVSPLGQTGRVLCHMVVARSRGLAIAITTAGNHVDCTVVVHAFCGKLA